ncbi:MAG: hypothetical protein IMZ71_02045 [Chloroflexi bacterium]|nr:hypothetical protein [Chloroflexota bacterium]
MTARLILSALIIIGTWLDVASTLYGYRRYGLREANAAWRVLLTWPVLFYATQTAFWGLMIVALIAGMATLELFIVLCVIRFGVVGWNVAQISKARRGR